MLPLIHIIDDDEGLRDAISWLLEGHEFSTRTWHSGEQFLEQFRTAKEKCLPPLTPGCLLIDIRMGGMSGLVLFDTLSTLGLLTPVIFITGHGDIPMAVTAVKNGAFDFIEKPFNEQNLLSRIREAVEKDHQRQQQQRQLQEQESLRSSQLAQLTERERQVMQHVLAGKQNKVIAEELAITIRTVEVHRARVFEKMGVRSAVELASKLHEDDPVVASALGSAKILETK